MKFADLINRLENFFKENPNKLGNDLDLVCDEFHEKFSEYKRIKKPVFKRQIEKALQIISNKKIVAQVIENKREDEDESSFDDDDDDSIDDQEFALACKGDNLNVVNTMITDIYNKNSTKKASTVNNVINQSDQQKKNSPEKCSTLMNKRKRISNENNLNRDSQNKQVRGETQDASNYKKGSIKGSGGRGADKEIVRSQISFDAFACDQELKENILRRIYYILSPEHFLQNGKTPPRGFLLHGPPGCGKTQLVYAIAGELDIPLLKVTSTELISGVSGESEENIRGIFDKAIMNAPCVLFIDEIEAISQRRETASKNMEHRIVTQLLSCFDDLALRPYVPIVVIGATNQADSLDIGLRRAGRFDQEIPIGIPDDKQRKRILEILCKKIKLNADVDMDSIVVNTPGYVGADLNALIDEALISALDRRLIDDLKNHNYENTQLFCSLIDWIKRKLNFIKENATIENVKSSEQNELTQSLIEITQLDFETAISRVQPSSKREGFATVPDVSWNDIGALQNVREELKIAVLAPVKYARQCEIFNFSKPPGILMVGPPGCGKTLLAKAIAKESGVNFISVKGPELLNMYVGESERAVRSLFQRARNSKPCVIFFDEIDAICVRRSDSSTDSGATTRVVNQMLTEMDGLESRKGVFLMAASNRPDIIDPAILRPGRLDKIIYVGLPTEQDRLEILKTITKNGTRPRIDENVDFEAIAKNERCQTYTGADLSALVREASEFALKEFIKNPVPENEIVKLKHFEMAFNKIKPSVSLKDCEKYERMKSICVNLE